MASVIVGWNCRFQDNRTVIVAGFTLPCNDTSYLTTVKRMTASALILPCALSILLLVGCHARPPTTPVNLPDFAAGCPTETLNATQICRWRNEVAWRVQTNFEHAAHYKGQHCDIVITYTPPQYYRVFRTLGDEALCLKAWETLSSTPHLPIPPNGAPHDMIVSFRPR